MKPQVVSFRCILRDTIGQHISTTVNLDVLNQSGEGDDLPRLAERMQGLRPGEKRKIALSAGEAYGFYDPNLVLETSRREICRAKVRVGDQVEVVDEAGDARPFRVTKLLGGRVWLDGNHPLAGRDLVFDIEVTDARDATQEELRESSPIGAPSEWMN